MPTPARTRRRSAGDRVGTGNTSTVATPGGGWPGATNAVELATLGGGSAGGGSAGGPCSASRPSTEVSAQGTSRPLAAT